MNFTPGPDDEFLDKDVARLVRTHRDALRKKAKDEWTAWNETWSSGS